jgi:hypothetical protein
MVSKTLVFTTVTILSMEVRFYVGSYQLFVPMCAIATPSIFIFQVPKEIQPFIEKSHFENSHHRRGHSSSSQTGQLSPSSSTVPTGRYLVGHMSHASMLKVCWPHVGHREQATFQDLRRLFVHTTHTRHPRH